MIIYAKYNDARKKEFRLITKIVREDSLLVLKEAENDEAKEFLLSLSDKYKMFQTEKMPFTVLEPQTLKDGVSFDFLGGETLDDKLFSAVKNCSKEDLEKVFVEYGELLKKIPTEKMKLSKDFKAIFGKNSGMINCLKVGCLDLTPENIKIVNGGYLHFDYEWTFDFPVPTEYVFIRSILNTYNKYADYNIARILPFRELLKKNKISNEFLKTSLEWERNFQFFVHGRHFGSLKNITEVVENIGTSGFSSFIETKNREIKDVREELAKKIHENEALRSKLRAVVGSRTWRTRNKVTKILGRGEIK